VVDPADLGTDLGVRIFTIGLILFSARFMAKFRNNDAPFVQDNRVTARKGYYKLQSIRLPFPPR
jgi:hypothetical protein